MELDKARESSRTRNTRDADWETLLWAAMPPQSTTQLREQAIDELEFRLESNEAALEVVRERLVVGIPVGTLPGWAPEFTLRSNTTRGDGQAH